jgi:hypothetical protein
VTPLGNPTAAAAVFRKNSGRTYGRKGGRGFPLAGRLAAGGGGGGGRERRPG